MTIEQEPTPQCADFIQHLRRFPEDLRDIRRLQRRFGLSGSEAARALDLWLLQDFVAQLKSSWTH